MLIRIAVAVSDKENEEKLIHKLTGISIVKKIEFDIAIYSNNFDKLVDNIKDQDIIISDFTILEEHKKRLGEIYINNNKCLPILIGPGCEHVCRYLLIRPVQHINTVEDIKPEDDNDKIKMVCDFFIELTAKQFESKTNNNVLHITTKQNSYVIAKNNILYCKSDLKYTVFVIDSGMMVRKLEKLQDVEEKYLWDFIRVHQSFLVNPEKVKGVDKKTNEIVLVNNTRIPFSRKYATAVRNLFNN